MDGDEQPTEDEQLALVEQLAARQLVSVAFMVRNECTVNTNIASMFDSGSSISVIRRSLVPFGCGAKKPSFYRGMGHFKLHTYGTVDCALRFRDRTVFHKLVIIPDGEALVPLLIGRDLMPKLNVHLCRTRRSYTRGQLLDFRMDENKYPLNNEIFSTLKSHCILRTSVKPAIDMSFVDKRNVVVKSVAASDKKEGSIVRTKIKLIEAPKQEVLAVYKDLGGLSNDNHEMELVELQDDVAFGDFVDLNNLIGAVTRVNETDALIISKDLSETDATLIGDMVITEYLTPISPIEPDDYSMKIRLVNDVPVHCAPRQFSYYERMEIRKTVDGLIQRGIVRPSDSPYASAMVLVKKKNGDLRLCVDFRAVNRLTIRDNYPIPLIEDCLEYFSGKKYSSTLDLRDGFHHIPMHRDSIKYTAFVTPFGQFEYTRMPFGLRNAPAVFQRYIHMKLKPLIDRGLIVVYLDDVSIATPDLESHTKILGEVLHCVRSAGLELNLSKCRFAFTEIDYLGYLINERGIQPSRTYVKSIREYPVPTNTKEVQRCNGLFSYFRRFVPRFSQVAKPLTDLLRKDMRFNWNEQCDEAFGYLRDKLVESPILAIYDPKREIELHCDASSHGFGAVLMQRQDDGVFHPVAYYSRKTSAVESKLISFEMETLAVVYALARFHTFVDRLPFTIVTDCEALAQTLKKRDMNPRIAKWALVLEKYDYRIQHRKGERMAHVDALSRMPIVAAIEASGVDVNVQITQSRDANIRAIREKLESGEWPGYVLEDGLVFRLNKTKRRQLMVPDEMIANVIRLVHEKCGHFGTDKCVSQIAKHYWFANMRERVGRFIGSCLKCIYYNAPYRREERNMYGIPKGNVPFDTIHIDHFGPLSTTRSRDKYVFAIVDAFSKHVKLYPVNTHGTKEACNALGRYFEYYSRPRRIISDRGTSFTSQEFERFIGQHNVEHIKVAVASPQSNGQVESVNRDLKAILGKLTDSVDHSDWKNWLVRV